MPFRKERHNGSERMIGREVLVLLAVSATLLEGYHLGDDEIHCYFNGAEGDCRGCHIHFTQEIPVNITAEVPFSAAIVFDSGNLNLTSSGSTGKLVDHANLHACRTEVGACLPSVPATSVGGVTVVTHEAAKISDVLELDHALTLAEGRWSIISHVRVYIDDGIKVDVARAVFRTVMVFFPAQSGLRFRSQTVGWTVKRPLAASTSCELCEPGHFAATTGLSKCQECDPATYAITNGSSSCEACPAFSSNVQVDLLFKQNRLEGFEQDRPEDCICLPGYWGDPTGGCAPCPTGAACCECLIDSTIEAANIAQDGAPCPFCLAGTTTPIPLKNYIISTADNVHGVGRPSDKVGPIVVPCEPYSCDGTRNNTCAEGSTGRRCGQCLSGYSKQTKGCKACSSKSVTSFVGFIMFALPFLITVFLLESNCREATFGALSLLDNILDVMFIISSIRITWSDAALSIFDIVSLINFDVRLFAPECAFGDLLISETEQALLWQFVPILFVLIHLLIFGIVVAVRTVVEVGKPEVKRPKLAITRLIHMETNKDVLCMFCSSMIRLLFLLYPILLVKSLQIFACIDLPDGTVASLSYPGIDCYSSEWDALLGVSILGIILYVVGFPIALLALFWKYGRESREPSTVFYKCCWPVLAEFRQGKWWFGFAELGQLFVFTTVVMVGAHKPFETMCITLICTVLWYLFATFQYPYKLAIENQCVMSIGALLITFMVLGQLGHVVAEKRDDVGVVQILIIITVLVMVVFILVRDLQFIYSIMVRLNAENQKAPGKKLRTVNSAMLEVENMMATHTFNSTTERVLDIGNASGQFSVPPSPIPSGKSVSGPSGVPPIGLSRSNSSQVFPISRPSTHDDTELIRGSPIVSSNGKGEVWPEPAEASLASGRAVYAPEPARADAPAVAKPELLPVAKPVEPAPMSPISDTRISAADTEAASSSAGVMGSK